jgi:hypothetical protein
LGEYIFGFSLGNFPKKFSKWIVLLRDPKNIHKQRSFLFFFFENYPRKEGSKVEKKAQERGWSSPQDKGFIKIIGGHA